MFVRLGRGGGGGGYGGGYGGYDDRKFFQLEFSRTVVFGVFF